MPWQGRTRIALGADRPVMAAIRLRIPGWARDSPAPGGLYRSPDRAGAVRIAVNGTPVAATPDPHGYVTHEREWRAGDAIEMCFPFKRSRTSVSAELRERVGTN